MKWLSQDFGTCLSKPPFGTVKTNGNKKMMGSKKLVTWALVGALAIGAAGCSQSTGPNQSGGTVIGAVAGGLIGSRFGGGGGKVAAVIAGTMLGGIVGSQIGKNMDDEARQQAYNAQYQAVSTGNPYNWQSSNSGPRGSVEPGPVYSESGRVCRQYTHTIIIDGRQERGVGTACRAPDGRWDIVN
jgi:surface antigen